MLDDNKGGGGDRIADGTDDDGDDDMIICDDPGINNAAFANSGANFTAMDACVVKYRNTASLIQ